MLRDICGRKRQVIADVIEHCSNTSHLEVIADVTMIRLLMPLFSGTVLYTHHVTHTHRLLRCKDGGFFFFTSAV